MKRIFVAFLLLFAIAGSGSSLAQSIRTPFYCADCLFSGVNTPFSPDVRNFIGITVNRYRPQHSGGRIGWQQGATVIICNSTSCVTFVFRSNIWTQVTAEEANTNKPGEYANDKEPVIENPLEAREGHEWRGQPPIFGGGVGGGSGTAPCCGRVDVGPIGRAP